MSKEVAELQEKINWHWRNSMRPVRFFALDAKAAAPFCLLLVYLRPVTLIFAAMTTMAFLYLEKQGLTFDAAIRRMRSWIVGVKRPALISFKHRRLRDFG